MTNKLGSANPNRIKKRRIKKGEHMKDYTITEICLIVIAACTAIKTMIYLF